MERAGVMRRAVALLGLPLAACAGLDGLQLPVPLAGQDIRERVVGNSPAMEHTNESVQGAPAAGPSDADGMGSLTAAGAGRTGPEEAPPPDALAVADDETLEGQRGGFVADGGLVMSLGITRSVFVNGQAVDNQTLDLSDLRGVPAAIGLVQIGRDGSNVFLADPSANVAGTVVQNTLDNQTIQTITTIHAATNSLEQLRALDLQSALRQAAITSLRR